MVCSISYLQRLLSMTSKLHHHHPALLRNASTRQRNSRPYRRPPSVSHKICGRRLSLMTNHKLFALLLSTSQVLNSR